MRLKFTCNCVFSNNFQLVSSSRASNIDPSFAMALFYCYKKFYSCDNILKIPGDYRPPVNTKSAPFQRSSSPSPRNSLQDVRDPVYKAFKNNLLKPAKSFKIRGTNLEDAGIIVSGHLKICDSDDYVNEALWDQISSRVDSSPPSTDLDTSESDVELNAHELPINQSKKLLPNFRRMLTNKEDTPGERKSFRLFTRMKKAITTALVPAKKKSRPPHTYDTVLYS